ncbi:beta-galactosidase [Sanguibacter sp. 25GB23B1]|uniref:beta-galactosidase n=1 Tax=unclassified Sanguibacter TaxID=2645534 RepID=UPI0032AF36E3
MTVPARAFSTDRFLFGGDYNPEQWTEDVWLEDIELMRAAGVNAVTIGVFSWSVLEPREGEYTFGWMDRIIELLDAAGIGVILATPTASPPPWFSVAHPDAMPVRPDGTRLTHGSRDTYAMSAPAYREACRRIARALAERYGAHPALRAWHVHNEYGTFDHSEHAAVAFRAWLRRRYGTLEALNAAWYSAFWSQSYTAWEQVQPPRATQYLHNPTQSVDFKRFCSDEMLDALREQSAEIRAAGSTAPITTNFMLPTWNHLEQWSWSAELDIVSIDHYLDTLTLDGETHAAYASDLTRSWAGQHPWLLMEQSTISSTMPGWRAHKEPDRMIRNSLSYVARGSQGALFFQWRAPAAGAEAWHGGLVSHVGPDSPSHRGVQELGRILASIAEVAAPPAEGPILDADVAILWHAEGWWALENTHLPSDHLDYSDAVRSTHRALWQAGLPVDFVAPDGDLGRYRLLLVPSMFAVSAELAAALAAYVEAGGTLVTWYFSGIADENLHVVPGGYPGVLRDLLGVRVTDLHPLDPEATVRLSDGSEAGTWSEQVELAGAEVVATYADGEVAGSPAVTRHPVGEGDAWYVSTRLDQDSLDRFLADLTYDLGIEPTVAGGDPELETVRRHGRDGTYLFVLNHGDAPRTLRAAGAAGTAGEGAAGPAGVELVSGTTVEDALTVAPRGVAVVRESGSPSWSVDAT